MAYIKRKDFKESCNFQEWVEYCEEDVVKGVLKVPLEVAKDILDIERPGRVVCTLKRGCKQNACIRKKCKLYLIEKKQEYIELLFKRLLNKLDKPKGKVDKKDADEG